MKLSTLKEKFKNFEPVGEQWAKHFAIMVPAIVGEDGEMKLLYEVRSHKIDRQPGEICFPGGMIEDGETPLEAALRETEEEIGIRPESIEIISRLTSITMSNTSQLHCFLGVISEADLKESEISRDEVHEVFMVPLDELLSVEPEVYFCRMNPEPDTDFPCRRVTGRDEYNWFTGSNPVPVIEASGRIIWGLTGRITMEVLRCLR